MIITVECPSCETSFPVDTDKVPEGGVNARCSVCAGIFPVDKPRAGADEEEGAEWLAGGAGPEVAEGVEERGEEPGAAPARGADEGALEVEEEPDAEPEPAGWEGEPLEPAVEAEEPDEGVVTPSWEMPGAEPVEAEPVEAVPVEAEPWDAEPVEAGDDGPATLEAEVDEDEEEVEVEPVEARDPGPGTVEAEVEEELETEPLAYGQEAAGVEEEADEAGAAGLDEWPGVGESLDLEEPTPAEPTAAPAGGAEAPSGAEMEVVEPDMDAREQEPGAGAVPETVVPPSEPPSGFQFGKRDPHEKAQRLARVLVSDMIMYNPERHGRALDGGTLKEDFEDEIQKSWDEYVDQVGLEMARSTSYFSDALNDILARGERIFEGNPPH